MKTLALTKTLYHENNSFSFLTSKTTSSRRFISLEEETIKVLCNWLITEKQRLLIQDEPLNTDRLLFMRQDGNPLRLAYLNDRLASIIKKYNLNQITVHGLRHTHASLLFESGASIKEVQERLGHSDIKMTMNIYTHVTKAVKEKTASRFSEFMAL